MRNSTIECLKLGAIFIIVVYHTIDSYSAIDLSRPTANIQQIVLEMIMYSRGTLGNMIFFVCSAWFLSEGAKFNPKKWLHMFLDIWVVSVLILCIFLGGDGGLSLKIVIKSLFPTICGNNWYLTCYLIFYLLYPILNNVINIMGQQRLLRATLLMGILYIGFDYIDEELFYPSPLILWVTIYFIIAYIRIYLSDISSNMKFNLILLCVGIVGHVGIFLMVNFLRLRVGFLEDRLRLGTASCNPFLILVAIALFNLVKNFYFENHFINHLSKLSLLIYIFHENIILRTYYRPNVVKYIYSNYDEQYILLWMGLLGIMIFLFAVIVSLIYENTLQKLVDIIVDKVYPYLTNVYRKIELQIIKLH